MYKRYHFKDNDRCTLHHRGELPRGSSLSLRAPGGQVPLTKCEQKFE